ncbi:hypothetical protein EK21DRAFT_118839 [Setomelanomma holmii]|uniref:Flavin reductase like domain-containing protein n=1 Tax=Setomelanomma holmii TaxID=210430 RepID=A0A9P4GX79_9PLEO|nr:hypothetical protein EK21DRAFT_118839 [Setomelanomma holmii]
MSSAWWLGNHCMLGLAATLQTTLNLLRTKQCVLNLASDNMASAVNVLAKTTGSKEVQSAGEQNGSLWFKRRNGYEHVSDKFTHSGLKPIHSSLIRPSRIADCPAQMEAESIAVHEMQQDVSSGALMALEVKIVRTHVHDAIRMAGYENRIDPDKWRPLIMSFQELYGLGEKVGKSEVGGN